MAFGDHEDEVNPFAAPQTDQFKDAYESQDSGPVEYGSFLARFAGAFLDGIITNVLGFLIGIIAGIVMVAAGIDPTSDGSQVLLQLIGGVIGLCYVGGFLSSSYQATPGKMAVGLKVTDLNGEKISFMRGVGRELGKIISALILLIGFLMQPFTEKKQALHDIMAGTLVVKR